MSPSSLCSTPRHQQARAAKLKAPPAGRRREQHGRPRKARDASAACGVAQHLACRTVSASAGRRPRKSKCESSEPFPSLGCVPPTIFSRKSMYTEGAFIRHRLSVDVHVCANRIGRSLRPSESSRETKREKNAPSIGPSSGPSFAVGSPCVRAASCSTRACVCAS